MILGNIKIKEAFRDEKWTVLDENGQTMFPNIGPNSVDMTLSKYFWTEKLGHFSLDEKIHERLHAGYLRLDPGEFILGCTREAIDCTHPLMIRDIRAQFVPMLEGRSTWARQGLAIHITAGFGDYGFNDAWTLELVNLGNDYIILREGVRIAQCYFMECYEPVLYKGTYRNANFRPKPPVKDNV